MTNRSDSLFAVRIKSDDGGSVQIAGWTSGDEGDTPKATIMIRPTPDAATPRPRWATTEIPAILWPSTPSRVTAATGLLNGLLTGKLSATQQVTVEGVWTMEFTEAEHAALDAGSGADLNSLKTRIAGLFEGTVPRSVRLDSLKESAEWVVTKPLIAVHEDDLDALSSPVLTGPVKVAAVDPEAIKDGILLTDGKTRFLPRTFWNGLSDVDFLRMAREADLYVLLAGPPGTGKSALVDAAFADLYREKGMSFKEDALTVGTEDTTVSDLIGGQAQDPETGIFKFRPGKGIKCAQAGVPWFIDEALLIDPRVLSVVYSLIDGRRVLPLPEEYNYTDPVSGMQNAVAAQPGFYIVFAGNPNVPGAVISEALASRCVLKPEYLTDYDTVERLLGSAHAEVVTVSRNMETKRQNGEVLWAPQMRDLLGYRDTATTFGTELALSNLIANCESESDREVFSDVIARVMGVSNIRPFRI